MTPAHDRREPYSMQTDSIILIALIINLFIATVAFAVPRMLDRRARAAAIDAAALRAAAGDRAKGGLRLAAWRDW
jgi:hypothetical protein